MQDHTTLTQKFANDFFFQLGKITFFFQWVYPGKWYSCSCVLKSWQQSRCNVIGQHEKLIIVICRFQVSKGLLLVRDNEVSGQQRPNDSKEKMY